MRAVGLALGLLLATNALAWGPGWAPCGYGCGGWPVTFGGYAYGGYNLMGLGLIQTPSFNYTTTIIQSPPIVMSPSGTVLSSPAYPPIAHEPPVDRP